MGRSQRRKGQRIEREAAAACRQYLMSPDSCMRTRQSDGKNDPDIRDALPGFRAEVKGRARISALRFYEKTEEECGLGERPIVLLREDGDTDFYALVRLADVNKLAWAYNENRTSLLANNGEPLLESPDLKGEFK